MFWIEFACFYLLVVENSRGVIKSYRVKIVKFYDCNTVHLDVSVFNVQVRLVCKLHGVKFPNIRSADPDEKRAADLCMMEILKRVGRQGKNYIAYIRGRKRYSVEIFLNEERTETLNQQIHGMGFGMLYDYNMD